MSLCSLGTRAASSSRRAASSFIALYSTVTGLAAWRNWGVAGPAPVSLVSNEEEPASAKKIHQNRPQTRREPTPPQFKAHRERMKAQFPEGWSPPRRLSRQAMDEKFRISPEAVRRILKSKWEPTREERMKLAQREELERQKYIAQRRLEERQQQWELKRQQLKTQARQNGTLTFT